MSTVGAIFLTAGLSLLVGVLVALLTHHLTTKKHSDDTSIKFGETLARMDEKICNMDVDIDEMKIDLKEHNRYAERFGQIEADLSSLKAESKANFDNVFHQLTRLESTKR